MRERGILFSGPMVRTILAGTKTQTRRILRDQPMLFVGGEGVTDDAGAPVPRQPAIINLYGDVKVQTCPYGVPGNRLWVRERFWVWWDVRHCGSVFPAGVVYAEDGAEMPVPPERHDAFQMHEQERHFPELQHHRPSIHMPRWASRITLEVTEVRVQRLQDISEEDARAEGADEEFEVDVADFVYGRPLNPTHRLGFKHLWDSINCDRAPWASNPWVWALTFRRVQP
jgi:hypothetical protein